MDPYKLTCQGSRYLAKPMKTIPVLIIQIFLFSPTLIQLYGIMMKRLVSCMQECVKAYLQLSSLKEQARTYTSLWLVGLVLSSLLRQSVLNRAETCTLALKMFLDNWHNVILFPIFLFLGNFPVALGDSSCTSCEQQDPL